MKLAVEQCFVEGLLGAVFATETLSLGINMPARTVVIERFSKFGGAGRATLTSGEYAQLDGPRGSSGPRRRGPRRHRLQRRDAVRATWPRSPSPRHRTCTARSGPTYNLTANLVGRFDRATAHEVLSRSYAQFEADRRSGPAAPPAHRDARTPPRRAPGARLRRRLVADRRAARSSAASTTRPTCSSPRPSLDGILDGLEPSLVAGVCSAFAFEPRRARRVGHTGPRRDPVVRARRGPGPTRPAAPRGARRAARDPREALGGPSRASRTSTSCRTPSTPSPRRPPRSPRGPRSVPRRRAGGRRARRRGGRPGRLRAHRAPGGGPLRAGGPPGAGPRDRPSAEEAARSRRALRRGPRAPDGHRPAAGRDLIFVVHASLRRGAVHRRGGRRSSGGT